MENMLIDLLVAFAKMMGISGEGLAFIIGIALLVLLVLAFVATVRIFSAVLTWFGFDLGNAKNASFDDDDDDFDFRNISSLAPTHTINATNINTTSIFDR